MAIDNIPLTVTENTQEIVLDIDDTSHPYYVGARAYVTQIPQGAIVTVIDKFGKTEATLLDGNYGNITDISYDPDTKTLKKVNGMVIDDVVTLSDVAISNDYEDLDNTPDLDQTIADWLDENPIGTSRILDESVTKAKLSAELQEDIPSPDRKNMYFAPLNATKVADLYVPANHYAQGATCDDVGNIYVFWTPSKNTEEIPCIVKYDANDLTSYTELSFESYPNIGHGNSIGYDSVNSVIVIVSSNGYVTLLNSSLQVVNHYYTGSGSSAYRFSQMAINEDYLVLNQTGSNSYYFYKRLTNKLFGMYAVGTYELGRGTRDLLQDAFIYQDCVIAISSGSAYDVYLSVIGVNTAYLTTYRIIGLAKEIEGGFAIGRDAYFVAADGSFYTCRMPNFDVANGTAQNPAIIPNYSRHIPSNAYYSSLASDVYEEISSASPNKYNVARVVPNLDIPFYNKINYLPERTTILGWNSFNVGFITNGSLRIETDIRGVQTHFSYTVQSNNTQVLTSIQLISNGNYRTVSFSADGSNFATKMESLFDTSEAIHLSIGDSNLGVTLYGCNKTSDAIANFFGILAS